MGNRFPGLVDVMLDPIWLISLDGGKRCYFGLRSLPDFFPPPTLDDGSELSSQG